MTNHTPVFTTGSQNVSFTENSNTTGSSALHTLTGTLNFTDSDHSDTHTTSATLHSAVWSGGSGIPSATLSDLATAMSSVVQSDNNGSGTVKWTFSDPDKDFDFLAKNETLVLSYDVSVTDNHGASTKQTVKVTVTGTDDKPVINMETVTVVNEQTNHTLSLSPDTAHIVLSFSDVDLDNTNYSATVTGVTASGATAGLLPGSLGTAELMAFYNVDNVSKAAGSSSGTVNTTFSAPDLAFDYLAAGQQLSITYTVQLDDHAGGISTQTVTVAVVGTNDKPVVLAFPESAHLTEGQNLSGGNLNAHGDFLFSDIDLSDTHTVSTTVTATRSGGGSIPISNADLIAAMGTTLYDSTGHLLGDVNWNFSLANSSVNFLSGGETLTLNYQITVTDPSGASDTENVTVTVLGTNHPVTITSGPESASLSEQADTTGSVTLDTTTPVPTGTLAFADPDTGDTHTVAVTVGSESWSGGSSIPAATQTALTTALQTTLHDSTGSGTGGVDWTFSVPDNTLDFLAAGETLTVNYNVKVSDATTNATQSVSVTVTGANDAPTITSGPESASLSEQPGMTGSSALDTTSPVPTGTLHFSDVDLTDTHVVGASLTSAVWSANPFFVPGDTASDLLSALHTTLNDSAGSGSGSVDWSFSIPDGDLDFLSSGETLTATYDVTVIDAAGAASIQAVTITMNGAADPLIITPVTAAAPDSPFADSGHLIASGTIADLAHPVDLSSPRTITEVNGDAANVGQPVDGTYGTLFLNSDGFYAYVANSAVDPLQVGNNPTDQFNFTVDDGQGHATTTTLTFNIIGADDAPVITAATAFGSVTEDAGPTATVNGGFESGDLTGWFATSGVSPDLLALGGAFGNYTAHLAGSGSLEQDVSTTAGQHYTLGFYVAGDSEASSTSFTAYWDGAAVLTLSNVPLGFTHYSFDVVGDTADPTTQFFADYSSDGTGLYFDELSVSPTTGPATETADGSISFADVETADTHTATFAPQSGGYVGTFSLGSVSEGGGNGSVGWHFTVNNADIQSLAQDQSISQTYTVSITGDHGAFTTQDVTVTINGANDPPTAVGETVTTDVGLGGTTDIPLWALALNDTDPDTTDAPRPNAIVSTSGGGSSLGLHDAFFTDNDGTLGGSFNYTVSDGHATSSNAATATIVNNPAGATALVGTSAGDVLIGHTGGGETLNGGGGNDALIAWGGGAVMTGGSGNDVFGIQSSSDAPITITDFDNVSSQDRIAIAASGFGLTTGQDPSSIFESTGDDQFIFANFHYDTGNQTLYYSPDGTTASAAIVAHFQSGVLLHANDLMVV